MKRRVLGSAVLCVCVVVLGALGCEPPRPAVPPRPIEKQKVIPRSFDEVWQTAVTWFATHNMPIKNLDKQSGLISTEYSLPTDQVARYMDCSAAAASGGDVEVEAPTGNFNLLIQGRHDGSTDVSVNVFFSCTVKYYGQEGLLVTERVLQSTQKKDCESTGALEREIWESFERAARRATPPASPAPSTPATASTPAPPPNRGQCTTDDECRAGRVCHEGACTYPTCMKDTDCPSPQVCERGACVAPADDRPAGCSKDTDCSAERICERGACVAPP